MRRWIRLLLIPALLIIALLSCVLVAYFLLVRQPNSRLNPVEAVALRVSLATRDRDLKAAAGNDPTPICFRVNQGDTASTIGAGLEQRGLLKDADLFRNYVRYYGIDARLQAGVYPLRQTFTIPEIAQTLTNAGASTVIFRTVEGHRIEEIMQTIRTANPPLAFTADDFFQLVGPGAVSHSDYVKNFAARFGLPPDHSLEGFLFPDTYNIPACDGADALVSRMLQNFEAKFTPDLQAEAQAQNLTVFQVVTLASIVEREAVVPDERPRIASVYLNRLRKPMKLDADPTVQYALGNRRDPVNWWPTITSADYQNVRDPYNTYLNDGLPPGPIASPGLSSILAVIRPDSTPYLYFRATCTGDGRHKFAQTFEEQQANAC